MEKKSIIRQFVDNYKENPGKFWEVVFAIVFAIVGAIFLLVDCLKIKTDGVKTFMSSTELFFGSDAYPLSGFSGFLRVFIFAIPIMSLMVIGISQFIEDLKGMSALFLVCGAVLVYCLPQIMQQAFPILANSSIELSTFGYLGMSLYVVSAVLFFLSEYTNESYSVSELAETAMLLAMAVIFSYIKIYSTDFGSINLQIIPLAMIALRCKPSRTFLACGVVYGLITCLFDGYGLFTYPLEYLVAFGSICILSFCRKSLFNEGRPVWWGYVAIALLISASTLVRYVCCVIDAVVFWEYDWGVAFIGASLPMLISGLFAIVGMEIMYAKPLFLINKMFPPADYKQLTQSDVTLDKIQDDNILK